jgi:hypothetical protein
MTAPQVDVPAELVLGGLEEPLEWGATHRGGSPGPGGQRGPKGARVGDVILAEGSRWLVESVNPERREATCRLMGGSCILRRFRARAIRKVERGAGPDPSMTTRGQRDAAGPAGQTDVVIPEPTSQSEA